MKLNELRSIIANLPDSAELGWVCTGYDVGEGHLAILYGGFSFSLDCFRDGETLLQMMERKQQEKDRHAAQSQ